MPDDDSLILNLARPVKNNCLFWNCIRSSLPEADPKRYEPHQLIPKPNKLQVEAVQRRNLSFKSFDCRCDRPFCFGWHSLGTQHSLMTRQSLLFIFPTEPTSSFESRKRRTQWHITHHYHHRTLISDYFCRPLTNKPDLVPVPISQPVQTRY